MLLLSSSRARQHHPLAARDSWPPGVNDTPLHWPPWPGPMLEDAVYEDDDYDYGDYFKTCGG